MNLGSKMVILCCCLALCISFRAQAQYSEEQNEESSEIVRYGVRYININLRSYEKLLKRTEDQQKRLLQKLEKKEHHFAQQLKQKDSVAYVRYQCQPLNYDSISRMLQPDSLTLAVKTRNKVNKAIDSLRGIQSFIQANAAKAGINSGELGKFNTEISGLQQKLSYDEYINSLIDQHTKSLKGFGASLNIPALEGIEKCLWAGKSKMAAWKQIADEPVQLETHALEYLQGSKGFDEALNSSTANPNTMQKGMDADALSAAGFQTKSSITNALQQKLGGNFNEVQQKMGSQVSEWQSKAKDLSVEVKQAKSEVKQSVQQIKSIQKPSFKINPMRGKPFLLRLEKQYGFQTSRSTDSKPATLVLSGSIGYRQTTKLSYGIGGLTLIGLGKNWNNIHFSFEGIGLSAYARLQLIWGINGYAAYERSWKQNVFTGSLTADPPSFKPSTHNTYNYTDACLIGMEKQYKISTRFNGTIQILADVWWREKGLNSPFILRFATIKK